jgi:phosphomannomutase
LAQKIKFGTDGWRAIIAEEFTTENVILEVQRVFRNEEYRNNMLSEFIELRNKLIISKDNIAILI